MTSTNVSSVALAEKYAREHFGLTLPFTVEELKSAFRSAAKKLHTDTSGDENTKRDFIAMKAAYDFLVKLEGMEYVYGERSAEGGQLVATDGTPLYELGLGLGPRKNGRDCERCQHKGFTEEPDFRNTCWECDPYGRVIADVPCTPCGGTGWFTQRRGGQRVICRVCRGRGEKFATITCPKCNGTKSVGKKRVRYSRCYECKGTGEIELFSPLILKGTIINVRR